MGLNEEIQKKIRNAVFIGIADCFVMPFDV